MLFRAFFIKVWKEKQNGESHSTSAVTLTQSLPDLSTIILPNDIQDPNSKLINVCVDKVWVDIDADAVDVVGVGDWMEGGEERREISRFDKRPPLVAASDESPAWHNGSSKFVASVYEASITKDGIRPNFFILILRQEGKAQYQPTP